MLGSSEEGPNKQLDDDIKAHTEAQQSKVAELAMKHSVLVKKIDDLIGLGTYYKNHRKPTLHNAILHAKAVEINEGG